jgi:hypothetical protein
VSTKNISTVQHQNSRPSTKPPRPPSTHTYRLHIIKEQAAFNGAPGCGGQSSSEEVKL